MFLMMSINRDELQSKVASLAAEGVFVGTSSWKYSGWRGMP
jgi:triosephosphate isomerase